jgi:hypothetical protein
VKRLLALVVAVGLVAGALWVRGLIDDGGGGGGGGGGSGDRALTVVCVTELAAVCEALAAEEPDLQVRIEEEAVTEQALTTADAVDDVDAWLTFAPFAQVVDEQRQRSGRFAVLDEPSDVLAWSPLVMAVWNDRRDVLTGRCGDEITWTCVGEVSGLPWSELGGPAAWGPVKPGHPTPETTAVGLLVLAQATGSFFGASTYASNDFADPAFRAWFERLERGIPSFPRPPRTPLDEMLSKGPAAFDLAGSTEAAAVPAIERSRDRDRLTVLYPSPSAVAEVVLVPIAGSDAGGRVLDLFTTDDATTALAAAGWQTHAADRPADDGLPSPGVLQALRSLWNEVL